MLSKDSLADVLFTIVLVVALWAWNASAYVAIVSATAAYLGVAALRSATHSETVRDVLISRQGHVTERYRIRQAPRLLPADLPQITYTPPPVLPGKSFVPAVDMSVAKDAVLWCLTLYGADGQPDAAKVNLKGDKEAPGRLKVAGPGSGAKEWLLSKHVLERVDHGLRLRVSRYPTANHIRSLLS